MPLFDAVCWAVGNKTSDGSYIVELWDQCVRDFIEKVQSCALKVYGTAPGGGEPRLIPATDFSGVEPDRVYHEAYLHLLGPADANSSDGKFRDELYYQGCESPAWCGLRVSKADVRLLWPSDDAQGIELQLARRFNQTTAAEFVFRYIAEQIEARNKPSLGKCRAAAQTAGYIGGRQLIDAAFRKHMRELGHGVRRGRPRKNLPK